MTSILYALKQATRPHHERLEQKLDLLAPSFSHTAYLRLIKAFWGYYLPLESRLAAIDELQAFLPDIHLRINKTPLLEADLLSLGIQGNALSQFPICHQLPACADLATALGCLYVLEGATLGGQVIARQLKHSLAPETCQALSFFKGYGDATGSMWQAFGERLIAARADEATQINSACETFIRLEQWLVSYEE